MNSEQVVGDAFLPAIRIVYVIDDDSDLRRSLQFLLRTRQMLVMPFASGEEFFTELGNLEPGPIVLDLRMPQMDGTQVVQELSNRRISWPVIVLSGHGDITMAVRTLKLGALDFLEKPPRPAELLRALEVAFEHLTCQVAAENCRHEAAKRVKLLSPREVEVLEYLCCGRSNKQVAFDLSISPRTVEMHRANALRHLNVHTLVEAAAVCSAAKS